MQICIEAINMADNWLRELLSVHYSLGIFGRLGRGSPGGSFQMLALTHFGHFLLNVQIAPKVWTHFGHILVTFWSL